MAKLSDMQVRLNIFAQEGRSIATKAIANLAQSIKNKAASLTYYDTGKLSRSGRVFTNVREARVSIIFKAVRSSKSYPKFNYAFYIEDKKPPSRNPDPNRGDSALPRALEHYSKTLRKNIATDLVTYMGRNIGRKI